VQGFLNTLPRTTFLARIRNPNPRMPDYAEQPLSTSEYARQQGGHETQPHPGTDTPPREQ
jgi:molybdopterin-containing oxidoreductase family iron-sulfur binding subunit